MTARLGVVLDALEAMHGCLQWHWHAGSDPFEICAGAILVQNTAWSNAERALDNLRAAEVLDADHIAAIGRTRLEDLVRPAGQFRQKARKLQCFAATCQSVGGLARLLALPTPDLRARLLATWGIGPETADCICCYAAGRDVVVVDAYTKRFFRRLGAGPARDGYHDWQRWISAEISGCPRWSGPKGAARVHALIVLHGKHLCRKQRPNCEECLLRPSCSFGNEFASHQ